MPKSSKLTPAWITVILTGLILGIGLIGSYYTLGEKQKTHSTQIKDNHDDIKSNKSKCDKRIETMQQQITEQRTIIIQQNSKNAERWIEVQTDLKWIKQDLKKNGN